MRRLIADIRRDERGGVAILLAFMMVALLGFTAFAVDVGMVYSERAQLQNGADSAAMAMAQTCAKDKNAAPCSESSTLPASLVNNNALDDLSNVKTFSLDKPHRTVTVTAGAQEAGEDPNEVTTYFAGALGIPSMEVAATAKVEWGSPIKGPAPFPMAVSVCQVEKGLLDGAVRLLQKHGTGTNSGCGGVAQPSGTTVPGGFAWIPSDTSVCGALIDIAFNEGASDPGNDAPSACSTQLNTWAAELTAGKQVVIFLPVYVSVTGTGSGASYDIYSFAALELHGWKFSGNSTLPSTFRNTTPASAACTGDCRGIIGRFIKYTSLADGFELGDVSPHGATIVQFIP